MQKFSKSPAVLEAEKGRKFQMFDGNITGEYVELVSNLIGSRKVKLGLTSVNIALFMPFLNVLWFLSEFTET